MLNAYPPTPFKMLILAILAGEVPIQHHVKSTSPPHHYVFFFFRPLCFFFPATSRLALAQDSSQGSRKGGDVPIDEGYRPAHCSTSTTMRC